MINVKLSTEEQRKAIAYAIKAKTADEEFFDWMVDEITKEYGMTEEDKEFFAWGFINGFIRCFEGVHYLITSERSSKNE